MENEVTQLNLRWHNFKDTVLSYFGYLRDEEEFVDVILSSEGKQMRAHKVVLAASSPYLQTLLEDNPCKHPCIILDDIPFNHLESLVAFIYTGKVRIIADDLSAFLDSANLLKIRGLTDVAVSESSGSGEETNEKLDESEDLPKPSSRSHTHKRISSTASISEVKLKEEDFNGGYESQGSSSSSSTITKQRIQHNWRSDCDEDPSQGDQRRQGQPDFRTNLSGEEINAGGKRLTSGEIGEEPPAKRPMPNMRRTLGTSFMPEPKGDESFVNGLTDAEIAAMGGPPPAPFFQQMQFSWRQDFDADSQGDARRRHSLDPRPCPVCNRVYSNLSNLRQHLRLIHNPKFVTCHLCSKTFKTDLYLRRHIMSYHELNVNVETGIQAASPIPLSVVEVKTMKGSPNPYCQSESAISSLSNMVNLKDPITN